MDTAISILNIADFAKRVELGRAEPEQEAWVREFLAGIMEDCPIDVLVAVAEAVLAKRRVELSQAGQTN